MSVGEYCNREVVVVERSESVREAVHLMRQHHVGSVVVVEERGEAAKPAGILTDRDIVIEVLAEDVDPDKVSIGDIMSTDPVTVDESATLLDALEIMRKQGVRRVLVVNAEGVLLGMLAVDDLLELLGEQVSALVELIRTEQAHERTLRD
ncbi:MAG: CBS domain-containing protein [Acidiferrobacterales bacterium]